MKVPIHWILHVLKQMDAKRQYGYGDHFDGCMCSNVPTREIVDGPNGRMIDRELPSIEAPDGWFELIHDANRRAIGREHGSLHLARAGWEANKEKIKALFQGSDEERAWLERIMKAWFDRVDEKTAKRKAYLAKLSS